MRISVITPVFHGNQYLDELIQSIENASNCNDVELVLVNDSPEIPLRYRVSEKIDIVEFSNSENVGIHRSRINGLRKSSGEYIIFLDQDDSLMPGSIDSYVGALDERNGRVDVVLGNGYIEDSKNVKRLIFGNSFSQKFATKERPYILARDFIVSPGQCLIRKAAIPGQWLNAGMVNNGMDDYLLWLLMFDKGAKFVCSYCTSYVHKNTGENLSLNVGKMRKSQLEMITILEEGDYSKKKLLKLKRAIDFKNNYKCFPLKYFLKYPIIFLYNIYYRAVWRGYICK